MTTFPTFAYNVGMATTTPSSVRFEPRVLERLTAFVEDVARRNGGRLLQAIPERLGEYVVQDFLRTRRQSRR